MEIDWKLIFYKVVENNVGIWLFSIIIIIAKFFDETILNFLITPFGFFYYYLIYINVAGSKKYSYLLVYQIIGCLFLLLLRESRNTSFILQLVTFSIGLPSIFYAYKTFISLPHLIFKDRLVLFLAVFIPVFSFKIKSFLLENFCKK